MYREQMFKNAAPAPNIRFCYYQQESEYDRAPKTAMKFCALQSQSACSVMFRGPGRQELGARQRYPQRFPRAGTTVCAINCGVLGGSRCWKASCPDTRAGPLQGEEGGQAGAVRGDTHTGHSVSGQIGEMSPGLV